MANRKTQPFKFNPRSVVDALDGGQVGPGGMSAATNLIFDPSNPFALQCRAASVKQTNFSGLTTPGFVSVAYIVGDIAYGLIASGAVAGYDQPFAYNLVTNTLVSMSGTQSSSTLPLTQSSSGTWIPPTMALVGPILYITSPGYTGGSNAFFGWIDTSNPASPVYYAGNTATNALPSVPTGVSSFAGSAWFIIGNTAAFTDAGNNTPTMTNSGGVQVVTVGDGTNILALAQMPVQTSTQGIIQSLIAFKQAAIGMITGLSTQNTLTVNVISSSVGCITPRTICSVPQGLMFEATDGIRTINQQGALTEPNPDLKVPFIYSATPSRDSAGYNNNIYRITVTNNNVNGSPKQEYWFDIRSNGWTGPHTFVQDMACPYNNTFVVFDSGNAPALYISDVIQSGTATFTELGNPMSWVFQTAPLADDGGLFEGSAVLTVQDMQLPGVVQNITFIASDVNNGVLSTCFINVSATGAIWDNFNWGTVPWTPVSYGFERYNIPWTNPLVFSRLIYEINGFSLSGFKIGKTAIGNEATKYVRAL